VRGRVFLDANILFSRAYLPASRLADLWRLPDTVLLSSSYAVEEVRRNLDNPKQREQLNRLLAHVEIVTTWPSSGLPRGIRLPDKDVPILLAAIEARATQLLTGDRRDFGHLFGRTVSGAEILLPAEYLKRRRPSAR
jgi:predicted nucleic acid-binding protein